MPIEESKSVLRPSEPFRPLFHGVVERQQHPAHAALRPNRLVRIDKRTIGVKAVQEAPLLLIECPRKPERQDIVEQRAQIELAALGARFSG